MYVIGLSATDWLYFDSDVLARIWGDGETIFVYRNYRSIRKKGVATRDGWLCSEIGVFSHMSCEFELFRTAVV